MSPTQSTRKFKMLVVIIVLILLLVGSAVVMYLSKQSQDTRQQAAVDNGIVLVSEKVSEVTYGGTSNTIFTVNTNNLQVSGVQLSFKLLGTFVSAPTVELLDTAGLQLAYNNVTPITGGYEVKVIAISKVTGGTYSTTGTTDFLKVSYSSNQIETVQFVFDNSASKANQANTYPLVDQLRTLATINVTIQPTSTPLPTPSNVPRSTNTPTPLPTNTPTPLPTPSNTPRPTNTPTPTPSNTPRPTSTPTPLPTNTPTPLPTNTPTPLPTPSNTPSPTASNSPVPTATPVAGYNRADINTDGDVDIEDYTILAGNFFKSASFSEGDITGEGIVTIDDYTIWALEATNFLLQ